MIISSLGDNYIQALSTVPGIVLHRRGSVICGQSPRVRDLGFRLGYSLNDWVSLDELPCLSGPQSSYL